MKMLKTSILSPEKETRSSGKLSLSIFHLNYFGKETSTQQASLCVFFFTFLSHSHCPSFFRLTFDLKKKKSAT